MKAIFKILSSVAILTFIIAIVPTKVNAEIQEKVIPATIVEIIPFGNGNMHIAKVRDENNVEFMSKPFHKGMATVGQSVEIHQKRLANNGNEQDLQFIFILCAAGGPVSFGICLGIGLVLLSSSVY